jgi:hypothetical protein
MRLTLERVTSLPKPLQPGVLYVSDEFELCAHLCACGCGEKVILPLGPPDWNVTEESGGPSLWPSVGSWQIACQSHYVISRGEVRWCEKWTPEQIEAGRRADEAKRAAYFEARADARRVCLFGRIWRWFRGLLGG